MKKKPNLVSRSGSDHAGTIRRLKRQDSIREKVLRGFTNQYQLANAYQVTQKTISQDLSTIYNQMVEESLDDHKVLKAFRIKQFEQIKILALQEFEKSKEDSEEIVTVKKKCTNCYGLGKVEDKPGIFDRCGTCKGKRIISNDETIRVKGQTGDPAYLRVIKECQTEIARIEGLYPRNVTSRKLELEAEMVGGKIHAKVSELYIEADGDLIIRCVATLDELKESIKSGSAKVIEAEHKRIESDQDQD